MQTTTRRPSRGLKPAATPFSATAAKLIEHLQAEARAQVLADLSSKDAITVLHGLDQDTKRVQVDGVSIEVIDAQGNCIDFYRRHVQPDSWRNCTLMAGYWQSAYWYGTKSFVDANGNKWSCVLAPMVCDDFGNLVQVAA